MNWWLIIRTPDGIYCWPVWGEHDAPDETLINAARVAVGFPAHDDWIDDGSGHSVSLTLGDLHPTLMARATVGTVADLNEVDAQLVAAHVQARAASMVQARKAAAQRVLADLDDATLKAVVTDPATAARLEAARTSIAMPAAVEATNEGG
jgi:hypothetical protein